jgi:hypothetical protein
MAWFLVVRTIRRQVDRPAQEDAAKFLERASLLSVARSSKRLASPRQAFHSRKVRTGGAGEMRGRDTKIQASPDRCRFYATLTEHQNICIVFEYWEASGVIWETRSVDLPFGVGKVP